MSWHNCDDTHCVVVLSAAICEKAHSVLEKVLVCFICYRRLTDTLHLKACWLQFICFSLFFISARCRQQLIINSGTNQWVLVMPRSLHHQLSDLQAPLRNQLRTWLWERAAMKNGYFWKRANARVKVHVRVDVMAIVNCCQTISTIK